MERRLAAILAADVAGYTSLMGAHEAGTLRFRAAKVYVTMPIELLIGLPSWFIRSDG